MTGKKRHYVKTYLHLGAAILFVLVAEIALFQSGTAQQFAPRMFGSNWIFCFAAFMVAGWIARHLAHRIRTRAAQYAGLALYALAQAILLMPLLWQAEQSMPGAIPSAAVLTVVGTLGLTLIALFSGKDFSFLRSALWWGGLIALALITLAWLTDVRLGLWFSGAMIGLAGMSVLSDTSRMVRRKRYQGRHVADALELFASVALMFWYALRWFRYSR